MTILYADDNPGDQDLMECALHEAGCCLDLRLVNDGEELLEYLHRSGRYVEESAPQPQLILLDLNMPRKGGLEALEEIKADDQLWSIPIVVLTASQLEADIVMAYDLGATAYLRKPADFDEFLMLMGTFGRWWEQVRETPGLDEYQLHTRLEEALAPAFGAPMRPQGEEGVSLDLGRFARRIELVGRGSAPAAGCATDDAGAAPMRESAFEYAAKRSSGTVGRK